MHGQTVLSRFFLQSIKKQGKPQQQGRLLLWLALLLD
jgi:hypothetical protein